MQTLRRKAHGAARVLRRYGVRGLLARLLGRTSPIRLHVESPLDGGYTRGGVTIRGWAFSTAGEIQRVEVLWRGKVIAFLRHGLPRPDVSDHFNERDALYSGFEGRFSMPQGNRVVSVQVADAAGNRASIRLRLRSDEIPPAQLHVDRAVLSGSLLTMEGWVLWAGSERPRIVRYFVNDTLLGESRCDLSRPDIDRRYTPEIAADCRGFFYQTDFAANHADLRIVVTERAGQRLERTVTVEREGDPPDGVRDVVADAIAVYRMAIGVDPSILNWGAGHEGDGVGYNVFSPPSDASILPYRDESIDLAVIADTANADEARRVARHAVIVEGANPLVEWKSGTPNIPTVSIVIPTYNNVEDTRTCLEQLRRTVPPYFAGEVIVADDGSTDATTAAIADIAKDWALLKLLRREQNTGFLENCNRAAAEATGEYLVFLNNDTLPQDGWLEALLLTFRQVPDAGAVGGKLLNPDGTLQEAGGLVGPDGSTAHFGAGDPAPNHPLYRHVREVDYCSGALLMTPRVLFEQIGGFDQRYKPAYFEDVDYCFSVRKSGYRVYFQPESVAVHKAHGSYENVKQRIEANREIFAAKWGAALAKQRVLSDDPYIAVDIHRRKRALFYGNRMPEFDRFGGLLRFYYLMNALTDAGWSVTFYGRDISGGERYAELLRQRGIMVFGGDLSHGVSDEYQPDPAPLIEAAQFNLAVLSLWQTAEPLIPVLRRYSPVTRIIVDSSDVHFVREARAQFAEQKHLDAVFARGLIGELNVYADADAMLTVSQGEADLVNSLIGRPDQAYVVPNMIRTTPSPHSFGERRGMIFVGNYIYPPNVEAVTYLIREILPLCPPDLLEEHPVYIVGQNAQSALASLVGERPFVHIVGWVPDVQPYLHHNRIAVVPLLNGAGTKTKLITALAHRTPAVATWIGAEGLGLQHERDVLIADRPVDFASAIARLLTDEMLWERLASAGLTHIEATHGYDFGRRRFESVINTVLGRSGSGRNNPTPVSR